MNEKLKPFNRCVNIFYAEAVDTFEWIAQHFEIRDIFSYRESGIRLTWMRDKAVRNWCSHQNVRWTECKRDGIQRGIKNREGWDRQWHGFMHAPIIQNVFSSQQFSMPAYPFITPDDLLQQWSDYPPNFQPAGEDVALRYLQSFMESRGVNYNKHISKPAESRVSCGRISPYLAWGNVSVRQVVRYALQHPQATNGKRWVDGFLTRVNWRDHFIQKFEVECDYETKCINAGYESLIKDENPAHIQAWEKGLTGFPLVDACMRCLHSTGWVNFRMRAMLVSFFCHHLYQDWRTGTYHMARLFLDYEPGIHYPQFQMQAGTTGINTVRIYNPVKQSHDHDPEGAFIKTWVPELRTVPIEFIHEPHLMSAEEQANCGVRIGTDYPRPIIALESASRHAREAIWGHRKKDEVKTEGKRIVETHARKSARSKKSQSVSQLKVF
jgi:deoxyribodipyrimidine photo-lyase